MPVSVVYRNNKYRVVDPDGKLARNNAGTPVDGGGFKTKEEAVAQARAINLRKK